MKFLLTFIMKFLLSPVMGFLGFVLVMFSGEVKAGRIAKSMQSAQVQWAQGEQGGS